MVSIEYRFDSLMKHCPVSIFSKVSLLSNYNYNFVLFQFSLDCPFRVRHISFILSRLFSTFALVFYSETNKFVIVML